MDSERFAATRRDYRGQPLEESQLVADPIEQFQRWFDEVLALDTLEPAAVALATTDDGQPSLRFVLLRGVSAEGFDVYTNLESRKSRELLANPRAALAWYWPELDRQVRAVGAVTPVSEDVADRYFATRPVGSQIGAWASPQSDPIPDRAVLEARINEACARFGVADLDARVGAVPRPPHWGGWRLHPVEMEFWQGRSNRLHDRFRYTRVGAGWERQRLAP
ncbi:MAG: pyridoxamine 5'-phosphate oxidase [Acidimicrobiia bacterium]